ncbi:universal stress protein [Streptomyces sp. NPDC101132]|uniref:universal stress protein n=1 Tax=Streptomyces sp. NPDC101132 TaxID=3366110 RepID=UPI0037F85A49
MDGSEHSLKALEWALATGAATGSEVVVAHVLPDHAQVWQARRTAVVGEPPETPDPVTAHVRLSLQGREGLPRVRFESLGGEVPGALNRAAEGAGMLVLGSRGRGGFTSLLLGSTSRACTATAPCPVVVVPHTARVAPPGSAAAEGAAAEDPGAAGSHRVLLGLEPTETPDEVIDFAFRQAVAGAHALTALTAFRDPVAPLPLLGAPMAGLPEDTAPLLREIERAQHERLDPFSRRYPQVVLDTLVGPGDAAGQLVGQSETAALLVVGRHRSRLRADSLLVGSVTNAALLHAHCPVAVVPAAA